VFHPDKHANEDLRVQAQEAFSRLQVRALAHSDSISCLSDP